MGKGRRSLSRAHGVGSPSAHELWRDPARNDRSLSRRARCSACRLHPWRLVAKPRARLVQPYGGGSKCPRHQRRVAGIQSLSAGRHRRHHRRDAPRIAASVATARQTHAGVRPFGGRPPHRCHDGDGLARARCEGAARSRACGLCDLRRLRPRALDRDLDERGFSPRRRARADNLAAVVAGAAAARSMRSRARSNRANSCAKAAPSSTHGGKRGRRHAMARSPAPIISRCSILWSTRRAKWWRASSNSCRRTDRASLHPSHHRNASSIRSP